MPVTRPEKLPRWGTSAPTMGFGNATSAAAVEPNDGKKDNGWGDGENPPAQTFQWLALTTYRALEWLFDVWRETSPGGNVSTERYIHAPGLTLSDGLTATTVAAGEANVTAGLSVGGATTLNGTLTVGGHATLGGGASVSSGQTLTLTGATVTGGTYSGQTLTSPTINGGTLTGTLTATGATFTALPSSGPVSGTTGTFTGAVSAASFSGSQVIEAKRVVGAVGQPAYSGTWRAPTGSEDNSGVGTWFYKDNAGRVWIYVSATGGKTGPSNPIFNLPEGYRPSTTQRIATYHVDDSSTTTVHYIVVESGGNVYLRRAVTSEATTAFTVVANGSVLL